MRFTLVVDGQIIGVKDDRAAIDAKWDAAVTEGLFHTMEIYDRDREGGDASKPIQTLIYHHNKDRVPCV